MKVSAKPLCQLIGFALLVLISTSVGWGAVTIDATTSRDQSSASTTVTTPALSTVSGNELFLAFIATDYRSGANTAVKSVSGGGLTWTMVLRTNVQSGSAEIWRAMAATPLRSVAITATLSQSVGSSMTVMSFAGVDSSGVNGSGAIGATGTGNASGGAPSATLTTTRDGSWVVGVGNDFDNAIGRTTGAKQTLVHQYLTPAGDTYWVQMQSSPTPASGTTVTINDTAPATDRYNLSICEILAASSGGTQTWSASGTITPTSAGVGASVALTGPANATVTADASGNYSFPGLANGAYTISPSKNGFSFTPASQNATVNNANLTGINFTAQSSPPPTFSISGTITPTSAGAGASVALTGLANATVTADASGNYSFPGLANGAYTINPSKSGFSFTPASQNATVNNANLSGINFTGQAIAPSGLAIDATASIDRAAASTTISTTSFSTTSANELLLALVGTDYVSGANTTVKNVAGAGLTWVLVVRTNTQSGTAEIWRAFAPTPLINVTVTATLSQSVLSSLTVISFSGVDTSGTNGSGAIGATGTGNSNRGAPTTTLTTTRNGSWVVGVGNDFDNAIARTPATGQKLVHQFLASIGDTYWVQALNGPTPVSGTAVTINDTAPTTDRYNLSICEILTASSGGSGDSTPPTVSMTSPAEGGTIASLSTVSATASDNVAVAGVLFLLDGNALGAEITSPPYSMTWNTAPASSGSHTLAARARDSAGLTTTSTPVTITVDNSGNPAVVGSWSSVVNLPAVAVNLILLPNNKVMFYQDGATPTVWDYNLNTFASFPAPANIFCSAHALLADGRILVAGGYGGSSNAFGIANAEIFDPATNVWTPVPSMSYKRWYPNATTLPDGRILVTAGWQSSAHTNAGVSEVYDPAANTWTQLTNANNPFETYPFMYVLPDGRIIHIGGTEYATDTDILDLSTSTWSVVDPNIVDGGSATMYMPGKFVKAGSAADSQNVGPSANTTFVLDMTQPSPAWQQTPSMAYPRSFLNLTTLPDGSVVATGGETDKDGGTIANAVYAAELWSPQTLTWSTMASMHTPREYHGTALLLPDARVLVSGMGGDPPFVTDQKSADFYSPPYLFKGARPTISQTPSHIPYGSSFFLGTPDGPSIARVALIRTGAVTHFFDQNERYVPLSFTQTTGGLTVTTPANANLAPPGLYMLFVVNSAGVPSIAPFVQVQ